MNISDARDWAEQYLHAFSEVERQRLLLQSGELFMREYRRPALALLETGVEMWSGISRTDADLPTRRVEEAKKNIEKRGAKPDAPLLFIKRIRHSSFGELFAIYSGPANYGNTGFIDRVDFARTQDGDSLRVCSAYEPCRTCDMTGEIRGVTCDSCDGAAWEHRGGLLVREEGAMKVVEVLRIQRPEDWPSDAPYYDEDDRIF